MPNVKPIKLTDFEQRCLEVLCEGYYSEDDVQFSSFAGIQSRMGTDRRTVRRACRSLARKGLAEYQRGLVTEDGEMAGAGYGATKEGAAVVEDYQNLKKQDSLWPPQTP